MKLAHRTLKSYSLMCLFLSDIAQYMQKSGRNDCLLFPLNTLKIISTF